MFIDVICEWCVREESGVQADDDDDGATVILEQQAWQKEKRDSITTDMTVCCLSSGNENALISWL